MSDELAEMLADAEHAEDDLASVLADEHDFDTALADDEQRIAGIVLEEDDAAARIELLARELAEALELGSVEAAEQRHRRRKSAVVVVTIDAGLEAEELRRSISNGVAPNRAARAVGAKLAWRQPLSNGQAIVVLVS